MPNRTKRSTLIATWLLLVTAGGAQAVDLLDPANGGALSLVDSEHNAREWAGAHLTDDDPDTRWLSSQAINDILYQLGSGKEESCFVGLTLRNYGSSRSIRSFSILSTTDVALAQDTGTANWIPVPADPKPNHLINHLHWAQGGRLESVQREHNSTNWAGKNSNNGNLRDAWLSSDNTNTLEFAFDTNWDGSTGEAINLEEIRLYNYGSSRSVSKFQIHVTQDGSSWAPIAVPGTAAGDPDFNFMLASEGALLTKVQGQHNSTNWAGANIHDGSNRSIWLNDRSSNELDFEFDVDFDGTSGLAGDADDLFSFESFYLDNYGSDRSVRLFQIEVQTLAEPGWTQLNVPGSVAGTPGFNFLLDWEGGNLTRVDDQHSPTTWAASHIHDGDLNTRWLNNRSVNELDFEFDVDGDGRSGLAGDSDDLFLVDSITLYNYGSDRSVRLFQVEVKTSGNPAWVAVEVPGTAAGDSNFNFALSHEGAVLANVDGELNSSGWAGANIHDGDLNTRWLMNRRGNSLEFVFDTDADGSTGDAINFSSIRIYNYGSDRSVQTFQVDVQTGGSLWTPVAAPGGGNTFSARRDAGAQDFAVAAQAGVTAVRLRTLSNYGDTYTGLAEFELLGRSVRASHTFTAQRSSGGETFVLDVTDQPSQVKALRFRSVQNYGDTYTGLAELEIIGSAIGPTHTFVAARRSGGETFVLDSAERPVDVTAVRFRSIQNFGDTYTGLREFQIFGPATRHGYTFEPGRETGPHVYSLDVEDRVDGVTGARFKTLNNHGDSYIGARELELLGRPVGPNYVFSANQASALQSFSLSPTAARVFRLRVFDNFGDSYVGAREIELESGSGCSGVSSRFRIRHDGNGLQCTAEPISVTALDDSGNQATSYAETIVLTSQTGTGDWTSDAANRGVFSDSTPGDGVARYQFVAGDSGVANFFLNQVVGATSVDVDVYQADNSGLRDDDSEGLLDLSPSGFTVTASALSNPPPSVLNDPLVANTAGELFDLHLAAYGTSASHPTCGILESYDGVKPIRFWIDHDDPSGAPFVPTIDGSPIASSEVGSASQDVQFTRGQAAVVGRYKDVGRIAILALDDSAKTSIRGSTGRFVSRPADLSVVAVTDSSGTANPQQSVPTGVLFARAGDPFVVRVEARDADGDRTPSYGREAVPEGIRLESSTLVAPVGGRNGTLDDGAIINDTSFLPVAPVGTFLGSAFAFDEVGAIRLRASVADGDYLGTGTFTGSESEVVGRFAPSRFEVTANTPVFETACSLGAFTWMGQPFQYRSGDEAELTVRAVNVAGTTTANYAQAWWRLTNGSLSGRAYTSSAAALDETGLPAAASDPAIVSNDDGTGTLTFSSGSGLVVARAAPVAPFDAEIQLAIDVLDLDGTACASNPFVIGGVGPGQGIGFSTSNRFQFGRLRALNANGSELSALAMPLRTERFDGSMFVVGGNDHCSTIPEAALILTPTPGSLSAPATIANHPLFSGESGLSLAAPQIPGSVDLRVDLGGGGAALPWLRYDWPEDGNLDGILDDDPRARATFGIWEGRRNLIFMQEVY